MRIKLPDFFLLPQASFSERNQKARVLHLTLWVLLFASIWIGIFNLTAGASVVGISLLLLSISCFVGLYLNYLKYFKTAAFILCAQLFLTMGYNLVVGDGLHDPGVAAYPIFILFAAYMFGKRTAFVATVFSILTVILIYMLGSTGIVRLTFVPTLERVALLALIYLASGGLAWLALQTSDATLAKLGESYDLTLKVWASALDARDGATPDHSRRVADLSARLGRALGCSKEEIAAIRRGAYLHDVGKMAIPDRVLFKKAPLSEEDWKAIRQHPSVAKAMIAEIPYLEPAASIPLSHHENWDGSGYPQGLKGEQIPLAARIFTVVDHWDALSSDRRYRKAWPRERILAYFEENAARIYDPRVVKMFLPMVAEHPLAGEDESEGEPETVD